MDISDRSGDWTQTYTGRFYVIDPRPGDIKIVDVGRSLSRVPRFLGHGIGNMSVAEHCVKMTQYVIAVGFPELAPWSLIHEVGETVIGDIPSPAKKAMNAKAIETPILMAAAKQFGLEWPIPEMLHLIDHRMMMTEAMYLFDPVPDWVDQGKIIPSVHVDCWDADEAQEQFLDMYQHVFNVQLCDICHGFGRIPCQECMGSVQVRCFQCNGIRSVPCGMCRTYFWK